MDTLRDTGCTVPDPCQCVALFKQHRCWHKGLLQGIEMGTKAVPLHWVYLESDIVSDCFRVGVVEKLPIKGVSLLLGNYIAGGTVNPVLEVVEKTNTGSDKDVLSAEFPNVFPACAVTRAQSRKLGDLVNLGDSVLVYTSASRESEAPTKAARLDPLRGCFVPQMWLRPRRGIVVW